MSIATETPPDIEKLFPSLVDVVYMNTASLGVGTASASKAIIRAVESWGEGRFDYLQAERAGEGARHLFAQLISVAAEDVSLIPTASGVAGQLASHLRTLPPGSNIVVGEREYTSNLFAWLQLRAFDIEVRLIPFEDGTIPTDSFSAAADRNTRLIAVSAVQSSSGYRADLGALRDIANRSNALLYVDAAQCVGAAVLDVAALELDVVAVPGHKFLLGTRGMGYAYFRPSLRDAMMPIAPGWKAANDPAASFYGPDMQLSKTASRFDQSLAWINALADHAALCVLTDIGITQIDRINIELTVHMREALQTKKVPFLDFGPSASTIFSVRPSIGNPAERLHDAGIVASLRNGHVRLSLHFYNNKSQIDHVVSVLTGQ
jgi:cysteine desulfurase / selenocysteine lyase